MEMKYITELLYDHDCVIIPGFGGFVSSYEHASLNREKNLFHPPYKKILFNSRLKNNDGIVANHIARKENITYEAAMKIIRRFAENCNKEMDAEKKVRFGGIGLLYKDENGNIQFDQDTRINYLPDAFGLTAFNSPVIYRREQPRTFRKKKDGATEVTLHKSSWVKAMKWAAVLIPLLAIGTWFFLNPQTIMQKYDEYAHYFAPITGDSQGEALSREDLEQQLREKKQDQNAFEVNQTSFVPSSSTSNDAAPEKAAEEIPAARTEEISSDASEEASATSEAATSSRGRSYYIITGSFLDDGNAEQHIRQLKAIGFSPAMAGKNQYGYYRVAAVQADTREEALNKLRFIRREDFADAWLLIK